ncbi:LysR family transcriptional activator of nhaA [Tamilnaduibacter salinus]|uniref:LysR family transcriptional activator of nhaA n=1 Tax=Tamilnaduibacter salinus TaxID=1484056 RepID=A0A2A2I8S4_9GAMM|nr:LysR family transcriptional regulator [Tamilnaduibacter salinus]PAV27525.1 LysR family transcriptional regulator [Tamilnaduibacter salinus]PVY77024.1 LysR family transcriptional activator of nhaA [Tamilnaduibacter salinus]
MNFKHLHYFWVVAREGSVARASECLHLAPQTLSGQVASLESSLGVQLFVRRGRSLQLTDRGHGVFRYADAMFQTAMQLENYLSQKNETQSLELNIGISASIHKLLAYRLIAPALEAAVPLTLKCRTGTPADLIRALRGRELQVVLTDRVPPADDEFRWHLHPVGSTSISLFAEPTLAAGLKEGFPQSLDGVPFLANALEAPYYQSLMEWLQHHGVVVREAAEIDDSALIKVFGRSGLGVFAAPTVIADEVCRQYEVDVVGRVDAVEDQLYAITRLNGLQHPGVAAICG